MMTMIINFLSFALTSSNVYFKFTFVLLNYKTAQMIINKYLSVCRAHLYFIYGFPFLYFPENLNYFHFPFISCMYINILSLSTHMEIINLFFRNFPQSKM